MSVGDSWEFFPAIKLDLGRVALFSGSALVRLHNQVRQLEQPNWDSLSQHLQSAKAYLSELQNRLRSRSVNLRRVKRARAAEVHFENRCTLLWRLLSSLDLALQKRERKQILRLLGELGPAIDSLAQVVSSWQKCASEAVIFSDLPGVNEILSIGLNILHGEPLEGSGLQARLPELYKWVEALQELHRDVEVEFPDEQEMVAQLKASLQDLQQGLGALVCFLEEEQMSDLAFALGLLDQGTRALSASLVVFRTLKKRRLVFSSDPILENLYTKAERWTQRPEAPQQVQLALKSLFEAHLIDLELTRQRTFLPYQHYDELREQLVECQSNLKEILGGLLEEAQADIFLENLSDFQSFAEDFDSLDQQLKAFERPRLNSSPVFKDLFDTMEEVYLERVRDEVLAEKTESLRAANRKFLQKLDSMAQKSEEDLLVEECLKEHAQGIEEIQHYLNSGERRSLLRAYDSLLLATLDLEELDQCQPTEDLDGSLNLLDSDSNLLQSRSFRQVLALVEADHAGRTELEDCLDSLRALIENAENASRELSIKARPLVYGGQDQEAQSHFEQLEVILQYQLDGLLRLEEAMARRDNQAIHEIVDELAEVDAYLLEFQETQEKLVGARPV